MNILVVNAGSTSFKCRLYRMPEEIELARGSVEKIGEKEAEVSFTGNGRVFASKMRREVPAHADAIRIIMDYLHADEHSPAGEHGEIDGVGFKTIQAGEKNGTVLLTPDVLAAMEQYAPLAPAHNPPYLACIKFCKTLFPAIPLVGVFEPGFHKNIPEYARIFGAPWEWYTEYGVVKYGYHGATFRYVTSRISALGLSGAERLILCHLGGSSSVCAVKNGISIDVSMSFTPQSGLLQSGRTGDIDAFVLPYIMERKKIGLDAALGELSSNGGLKGISGIGSDMRDIQAAAANGNQRAQIAIDKFVYDVVRYIGSFHVLLGGVDTIVFSGGIGYHNGVIRRQIIDRVAFLGVELDDAANLNSRCEGLITLPASPIAVAVIDTNEEIVVARETVSLLSKR